jgi:lysozyme family protein
MADFDRAIKFVLYHEGGYVNDPNDPGGETKFGISKKAYPALDIRNLTEEQARGIYKKDYWQPSRADTLDDSLALVHFDTAVNMGLKRANALLEASGQNAGDYLLKRIGFYVALTRKNAKLKTFLNGWIGRVMDCYNEIS